MPDNVPGGSIVKRVRYNVSPRLKSDTGLVFYSRCLIYSLGPSFEGLFLLGIRRCVLP
ncbi:pyrBI operon leader peptide [Escherichia coli]|uniref:pyrBI operon leader peptide n=1 Tax=Escherichia coli TaxID=562 RepID=UPI000BF7414B|nr:pyrBI operon leader peptide [Escherichia coli]